MTSKKRNLITLVATWLTFGLGANSVAHAGDAASIDAHQARSEQFGTITGRVQNLVTGRYLNNARVTLRGTDLHVLTDDDGTYRFTQVPAGAAWIEVFYTGLEPQSLLIQVLAGGQVTQDVKLAPAGGGALVLDPFTVEEAKVTDQTLIAINEQRFSPNIKTVVATGDISEQPDGNIGEFLKMLPGVATAGGGSVPAAIYIRGFPPSTTQITVDGASIASTGFDTPNREVQVSNETPGTGISRLEVTKVPTPATGADTMAGSVNMVTRTAFEANRAQFTYLVNVAGVLSQIGLKQPTGWEEDKFLVKPGASFRYTNPVTKNFGFAISASASLRQRPGDSANPTFNFNSATFGSSPSAPMLETMAFSRNSAIFELANFSAKADWRITSTSVLATSFETYHWRGLTESFTFSTTTGTAATSTPAGGMAGSYGPDFTAGATGRGSLSFANGFGINNKAGVRGNVRYSFNNGDWKVDLQTGQSKARYWGTDGRDGTFANVVTTAFGSLRVDMRDIDPIFGPRSIKVFDNSNQEVDIHDPSILNRTNISRADLLPKRNQDRVQEYKVDVRRNLGFLPFPASLQVGASWRSRNLDYQANTSRWTYRGPGGNQTAAPFATVQTFAQGALKGKSVSMVSPVLAYRAWEKDPSLFYQTPAQIAETERVYRFNSENIKEIAEALYFQIQGRFLNGRLNVLTGVRYERTIGEGQGSLNTPGAVWQRHPDGSYVLGANGARVRKPEAGLAGSLEEVQLVWQRRAARSKRTYDGYYPSVHLNYNVSENMLVRLAFAQTYGRPNFSFIVPRTVVSENIDEDGDVTSGRLTMRNPSLLPWTANNYDLSLEYYTPHGGVFGVGLFRKEVKNFFGTQERTATTQDLEEAGVDPNLVDPNTWIVSTTVNLTDADVNGFEVSMNHSLRPLDRWLGSWIGNFHLFANATKLQITGPGADALAGFLPLGVNGGLRFSKKPFMASVSANYRSEEITSVVTNIGPNGRNYRPARTHIDVAASVNLRRGLDLFFNVRNLTDVPVRTLRKSDVLPSYARRGARGYFGAAFNAGVRGSF